MHQSKDPEPTTDSIVFTVQDYSHCVRLCVCKVAKKLLTSDHRFHFHHKGGNEKVREYCHGNWATNA